MRMLLHVVALVMCCSACVGYNPREFKEYDKLLAQQPMILFAETGKHRINHRPGFIIYMKPDKANEINAPYSQTFQQLLDGHLAIEEKKSGRSFCSKGYRIVGDYTYYFRIINAECEVDSQTNKPMGSDSIDAKK